MNLSRSIPSHALGRATLRFLSEQLDNPASFHAVIHPEDEMFLFELATSGHDRELATWRYFRMGALIANAVGQFVRSNFGGFSNINSLLEFAAGYGRVSRWLVREMPIERIFVSDIYPGAVAFQRDYLGVQAFVSTPEPEGLTVDRTFDFIVVISLFSHLPASLFEGWLKRLSELLSQGGVLAFSVHDHSLLPPGLTLTDNGSLFLGQSESQSLPKEEYGTMYVNERFVQNVAENVSPNSTLVRVPRALSCFQDVYLLARASRARPSVRDYQYGPVGAVEALEIDDCRLCVEGRTGDLTEGSSISVSAWLNDTCLGECRPHIPRPDVVAWTGFESSLLSGFNLTVNLPLGYSPDDLLLVKSTSDSGLSYILHVGTLAHSAALFARSVTSGPQPYPPSKPGWLPTPSRLREWSKLILRRH